jgi:GT2 family glycosyltransferase
MRLAVLVTCHNRRDVTLTGLGHLVAALAKVPTLRPEYFVVDDGSIDGTGDAVREVFPEVRVIQGSGRLFWAGGMAVAYAEARREQEPFDAYLLFNDDVTVEAGAVSSCLVAYDEWNRTRPTVVVGACTSLVTGAFTYGGWLRASHVKVLGYTQVFGDGACREVDTFNGNFVLVPARIFEPLGGLDGRYRHAYADLDFGLRARRRGARIFVHHIPVGTCERGTALADKAAQLGLRPAWRTLVTGPSGLMPFMRFARRHGVRLLLPLYFCHELATRLRLLLVSRPRIRGISAVYHRRKSGAGSSATQRISARVADGERPDFARDSARSNDHESDASRSQ